MHTQFIFSSFFLLGFGVRFHTQLGPRQLRTVSCCHAALAVALVLTWRWGKATCGMENYLSYLLSLTPPKLTNTASSEKGPFQEENCLFRGYVCSQGIVDHFPYIFHGYISCMGWLGSGGSSCLVTLLGMFLLCSKYGSWYLSRYCTVLWSHLLYDIFNNESTPHAENSWKF